MTTAKLHWCKDQGVPQAVDKIPTIQKHSNKNIQINILILVITTIAAITIIINIYAGRSYAFQPDPVTCLHELFGVHPAGAVVVQDVEQGFHLSHVDLHLTEKGHDERLSLPSGGTWGELGSPSMGYIILYYIILYNIILCYIILYYIMLYYTILYYTIRYYTILYDTIRYYTILYYTILCYIILYYTMLCYTILYHITLYYAILYYIILYYTI